MPEFADQLTDQTTPASNWFPEMPSGILAVASWLDDLQNAYPAFGF
ncbi:hypothetical protein LG293_17325 (plasmid) [Citricoccus nitrophenolicus]